MARSTRVTAPRRGTRFHARPIVLALAAAGVIAPAHGATIAVTTGGDAGNVSTCTVRQAVASLNLAALQAACANSGGAFGTNDTVDLTLQSGTITLAGTPLESELDEMRFLGPGAAALIIALLSFPFVSGESRTSMTQARTLAETTAFAALEMRTGCTFAAQAGQETWKSSTAI